MRTLLVSFHIAFILVAAPASAEQASEGPAAKAKVDWSFWVLENRAYFEPLLAEPRAAQITALVFDRASEFPYMVKKGRRGIWNISLGKEVPILGFEGGSAQSSCSASTGRMPAGCWGFGLWAPVSFHMVEDFKGDSFPVINTDYRFSVLAKAQRGLEQGSLAFRVQAGHESTHLGDEFTIAASAEFGNAFERINVSYEYWEYGVSYERWFSDERHVVTLRHGGIGVVKRAAGFYGDHLLGETTPSLTPSNKNFEPSFGIEWRRPDDPIISKWAPLASLDIRLKTVYNFHRAPNSSDERDWSVGAVIGVRRVDQAFNQKGVPILIGRVYYGVNPNGQFRSQRKFFEWGLGFIIPI